MRPWVAFSLLLYVASTATAWTGTRMRRSKPSGPPTYVQHYQTGWGSSSTPNNTSSFSVLAGDVLVAYSMTANDATTVSVSGGSLSWTLQQSIGVTNYSRLYIWTAVVDVDKSMNMSFSRGGSLNNFGGGAFTFRGSSGIGASSSTNTTGAPSLNLTTIGSQSAIVVISADWNALSSARTWRTGAGALTESAYTYTAGQYTIYAGFHANAGAPGTYTVGLSAPAGQQYSIGAIEVKGP